LVTPNNIITWEAGRWNERGNLLTFISISSRFWSTASRWVMGSTSTAAVGGERGDDVNGVGSISRSGDLSRWPITSGKGKGKCIYMAVCKWLHQYKNSRSIWHYTVLSATQAVVTFPPLPQAKAGTQFSDIKGMQGWADLVALATYQDGKPTRRHRTNKGQCKKNFIHGINNITASVGTIYRDIIEYCDISVISHRLDIAIFIPQTWRYSTQL